MISYIKWYYITESYHVVFENSEGAPPIEQENLLRELNLMKKFKSHPNVLGLVGCCIDKGILQKKKKKIVTSLRKRKGS